MMKAVLHQTEYKGTRKTNVNTSWGARGYHRGANGGPFSLNMGKPSMSLRQ